MAEIKTEMETIPISGLWLRGGENKFEVLVEVNGKWRLVIDEYVPTNGNDGNVWPISHIAETGAIQNAKPND